MIKAKGFELKVVDPSRCAEGRCDREFFNGIQDLCALNLARRLARPLSRHHSRRDLVRETGWLIDAVGSPVGVDVALQWLKAGPFKELSLKLVRGAEGGKAKVRTLDEVMSAKRVIM